MVVDLSDENNAESVAYKGVCSDEMITEHLGDHITTELKDMAGKSVNCQRALWYNSEGSVKPGVLVLRMQDLDRRNAVHAAREAAAANKSARAVIKAAQATAVIEAVVVESRQNPDFVGFCSKLELNLTY